MLRFFIKEEKRRIHSWTKVITYAFRDIEASVKMLKFYFGEKAKMQLKELYESTNFLSLTKNRKRRK